jgi:predicted MFS family arabinose efflux permease
VAGTLPIECGAAQRPVRRRYAWSVFGIVFALMVVDYVDRQVVVSMFPQLKVQWRLSDGQLGGLVSVVSLVVAVGTVPLSILADRWGRVKSMFVMALVWSSATMACGYARDYRDLLLARGLVGLGEAAYGSAGAALLASGRPRLAQSACRVWCSRGCSS